MNRYCEVVVLLTVAVLTVANRNLSLEEYIEDGVNNKYRKDFSPWT